MRESMFGCSISVSGDTFKICINSGMPEQSSYAMSCIHTRVVLRVFRFHSARSCKPARSVVWLLVPIIIRADCFRKAY